MLRKSLLWIVIISLLQLMGSFEAAPWPYKHEHRKKPLQTGQFIFSGVNRVMVVALGPDPGLAEPNELPLTYNCSSTLDTCFLKRYWLVMIRIASFRSGFFGPSNHNELHLLNL